MPEIRDRDSVESFGHRVLGIVLAGGKGTRLFPLTRERAKPAVPFGGKYRIIDFVLSNFVNSGIYSIYVLTQFRSQSLLQHLSEGWQFSSLLKSQFITHVPAQMQSEKESWYEGTADAIFQNINLIEQSDPHMVAIFGANAITIVIAKSAVPAPAFTGTYCAVDVSDNASSTLPIAIMAIHAGEPRYIQIANIRWKRLTGFRPGMLSSFQYCMLPWHQRRSRRLNSISVGGFSSQLTPSTGSTRTS